MRRALAAALLGISLWIGSLAWTGFLMTRTVLDPGRSEAVADALLDDPAVRAQLEANIAGGVVAALPPGAPIDDATIEAGAATALASPAVETLFRDALVRTHQAFLGEGDRPRSIDGAAFGSSARDALVAERPELAGVLPSAPSVDVPLPTERLPNLGPVRDVLQRIVPLLASTAAVGTVLALVVARDRPRVLRRAGFWAIGLSALALLIAFGVPALAQEVAPDQATVVAALIGALAASARAPAVVLCGAGIAAIVVSALWRTAPAPAPARPPRRARAAHPAPGRTSGSVTTMPRGPRASGSAAGVRPHRTSGSATTVRPEHPAGGSAPAVQAPVPAPPLDHTSVLAGPSDATRVESGPVDATRVESAATAPPDRRPNARWVPGVGWVHEGSDPIPPGARWVVGVGYVLPD